MILPTIAHGIADIKIGVAVDVRRSAGGPLVTTGSTGLQMAWRPFPVWTETLRVGQPRTASVGLGNAGERAFPGMEAPVLRWSGGGHPAATAVPADDRHLSSGRARQATTSSQQEEACHRSIGGSRWMSRGVRRSHGTGGSGGMLGWGRSGRSLCPGWAFVRCRCRSLVMGLGRFVFGCFPWPALFLENGA
jgi:hypothetical protein